MVRIRDQELVRPYKVTHQNLCITNVSFIKQSLLGYVELYILPIKTELSKIKLNCKQCKIYRVEINDSIEAQFSYTDPTLEICTSDMKQRNLDTFSTQHAITVHSVDPDRNTGELIIELPDELSSSIADQKTFRLLIEFSLERPNAGIHFVIPERGPNGEAGDFAARAAHMFTYSYGPGSRLWFPCVDAYSEPCTWKLEFTVDANMIAVSNGDLIETVFTTPDHKKKTYHYQLITPTSAPNIGLAVGPFEVLVDPNMHEVTHFCLPHLMPLLKDTTAFLHETFEFFEELLSQRYPYTCYKQVFVDEAESDCASYATLSILNTNLLHSRHIIDQTYITRKVLATGIAQQFFGCLINMNRWSDAWLVRGLASFLASQFYKKTFGNNAYRAEVQRELQAVVEYEQKYGGILLDISRLPRAPQNQPWDESSPHYFSQRYQHTTSPLYSEAHRLKSGLVMRMLEIYIGRALLFQVFNKILSLATYSTQQKVNPTAINAWQHLLISTNTFAKAIYTVTGKEINAFLDQWIYQGGHPKFHGSFIFDRKRNVVELEIKQLETTALGIRRYMGPLIVTLQELDGTFVHKLQIEENTSKHVITCHSKSRRNKKKKIPLCTGEEVDMDLSHMDPDSPVLWIRIDPDMQLIRQVVFEQPDFQWQYQLRYERDVCAQIEAINYLDNFVTKLTRKVLTDIIENDKCFYQVRCAAAHCLTRVANKMASQWTGPPAMKDIFKKLFGSHSCPDIIKLNNFSNFQHYFLQKEMPKAMALLRNQHNICPPEVLKFLIDLFKYNDNAKNRFSDNYYRSSLVEALASTSTPVVSAVLARSGQHHITAESLSSESKLILEEVTRYFNVEKLLPCYKHTVTISCIKAFRHLQKMSHLPSNPAFFKEYTQYGLFIDIRLAALEALVDITKIEIRKEEFDYLIDLIETDPVPSVRYAIIRMLIDNPPFTKNANHPLNTEDVVERLWKILNYSYGHDAKLRCAIADLYFTLFGRQRPSCLPRPELSVTLNLKERRTTLNPNLVAAADEEMEEEQKEPPSDDFQLPPLDEERDETKIRDEVDNEMLNEEGEEKGSELMPEEYPSSPPRHEDKSPEPVDHDFEAERPKSPSPPPQTEQEERIEDQPEPMEEDIPKEEGEVEEPKEKEQQRDMEEGEISDESEETPNRVEEPPPEPGPSSFGLKIKLPLGDMREDKERGSDGDRHKHKDKKKKKKKKKKEEKDKEKHKHKHKHKHDKDKDKERKSKEKSH